MGSTNKKWASRGKVYESREFAPRLFRTQTLGDRIELGRYRIRYEDRTEVEMEDRAGEDKERIK